MSIKRLATHVAGGAAIAAAMAAFTVVPAHAADTYVAIYYSAPEYAYGWANNAPTRADAEAAAHDKCVYNGGTDCQMAAWARNGCAALAHNADTWHGGHGATIAEAEQDALALNNGGSIFIEKCST
ncbi:MAG: DUF4189 domain-containing protein [Mycobacterium sp.]